MMECNIPNSLSAGDVGVRDGGWHQMVGQDSLSHPVWRGAKDQSSFLVYRSRNTSEVTDTSLRLSSEA